MVNSKITIFILLVLLFPGSLLFGQFVQQNMVVQKLDAYGYELIANGPHNPVLDTLVWPINTNFLHVGGTNMPSYFLVLLGIFFLILIIFKRNLLVWALITFIISNFIIGASYKFNSHYIFRQRPYVTLPNSLDEPFKKALMGWNSYPSGHVRDTVVYSMIIAAFIPPLTVPLILFSLFIGWSRIYVGAHFPTDIVAGVLIGFIIGKIGLLLTKELQLLYMRLRHKHDQNK